MKGLSGLLKRKFNEIYREISEDIEAFGRSRYYLWRWAFIVLDDASKEGSDFYVELNTLLSLKRKMLLPEEKVLLMTTSAYFYATKLGEYKEAEKLLMDAEVIAKKVNDSQLANPLLLRIAEIGTSIGLSYGMRLADSLLRNATRFEPLKKVEILSRLANAYSKVDLATAESLFYEAIKAYNSCNLAERVIAGAVIAHYSLSSRVRIPEAGELAQRSIKLLQELRGDRKWEVSIAALPYLCSLNPVFCDKMFHSMLEAAKSDIMKLASLAECAEKTAELDEAECADRMLQTMESMMYELDLSLSEISYLMARVAAAWRYVDGRKAKVFVPIIHRNVRMAIEREKGRRSLLISAVKWLGEVDLFSAYILLSSLLDSAETIAEKADVLIELKKTFPKDIKGLALKVMLETWNGELDWVIQAVRLAKSLEMSVSEPLVRKLFNTLENLEGREFIEKAIEASEILSSSAPYLSRQLALAALEEAEELEGIDRARALYNVARVVTKFDKKLAEDVIRKAIVLVEQEGYEREHDLALKLSDLLAEVGKKHVAEQLKKRVAQEIRRARRWKEH